MVSTCQLCPCRRASRHYGNHTVADSSSYSYPASVGAHVVNYNSHGRNYNDGDEVGDNAKKMSDNYARARPLLLG